MTNRIQFQGIPNINLSTAHYDTNYVTVAKLFKHVMPKAIESQLAANYTDERTSTLSFLLLVTLFVILQLLKCRPLRNETLNFSLEFIQLLQNRLSRQRYITSNATIPDTERIYPKFEFLLMYLLTVFHL